MMIAHGAATHALEENFTTAPPLAIVASTGAFEEYDSPKRGARANSANSVMGLSCVV